MFGLMQRTPLLLSSLLSYAAQYHGDTEIITRSVEGPVVRMDYRAIADRAGRLARALARLGVAPGERVATLAWNTHRHMELYFGATGTGTILHTVNPRLFPAQIEYILNHAEDRLVFFDLSFAKLVESLAASLPSVRGFVVMTDRAHMPSIAIDNLMCYEDLIAAEPGGFEWPTLDEHTGATLCYTSGTTGEPKGVLYSHRSLVLHSFCTVAADGMGLSSQDSVLLATPLFHVNAWGIPFAAAMCGAKLVLPGPSLDGESLYALMRDEACTFTLGVPTIWLGFLDYVQRHRASLDLSEIRLKRVMIGGSAAPRAIIEAFDRVFGAFVIHAWGMTETSPIATIGTLLPKHRDLDAQARYDIQAKQGRAMFGVDLRLRADDGTTLPHDGVAVGDLMVRGPWVTSGYFGRDDQVLDAEGWFSTGDVASIDPDGYVTITDRSKDVIKSGGEWISSIALENAAVGHPGVQEAAVIGVAHEKWQERPLLLVIPRPEGAPTEAELLHYLSDKVARWWLPDAVVFVDALPHTATGKLLKTALRAEYRDHLLAAVSG